MVPYLLSLVFFLLALLFCILWAVNRRRHAQALAQLREELLRQEENHANALDLIQQDFERQYLQKAEQLRSALSHSVRVPLSIVQGYAELLHDDLVPDESVRQEYLAKIVQHSKDIGRVLSQQLSAARSDEDLKMDDTPVDLLRLIRQAAVDFQASAGLQGISIQVLSQEERAMVRGDAGQLTRIFYNILENARKYMGREGMVTVRLVAEGPELKLSFKDDGMGLSEEETPHIFEARFQGSNRQGGHGHGLYLVRRIVEAHNGTISAESSPGRGMAILITLPQAPMKKEEKKVAPLIPSTAETVSRA